MILRSKETAYERFSALWFWRKEGILIQDGHLMFCNGAKDSVTVPEGIISMESEAFDACCGCTRLSLPMTLTQIRFLSFPQEIYFGFTELVVGKLAGRYDELFRANNLEKIEIREGTRALADSVFALNDITRIEIPASIRKIGSGAFGRCEKLKEIVFLGDAPDIAEDAFDEVEATVWIPSGNPTWTQQKQCGYSGDLIYTTWPPEREKFESSEEEPMKKQEQEAIDVTKYMPRRTIRYFVRDEGPDAWGASLVVKEGSLVRPSGYGQWREIEKDTVMYLESPGERLEVYEPGASEIMEYIAYR